MSSTHYSEQIKMISIISFMFVLQAITNVVANLTMAKVQPEDNIFRCRNTENFTGVAYRNNIKTALDDVAKHIAAKEGFYFSSSGRGEQVSAIGLCPGYTTPSDCESCVKNSMSLIETNCRFQKEAVAWILNCMIRYSNREILGVLDDWVWVHLANPNVVPKVSEMDNALYDLTTTLKGIAVKSGDRQKFAYGKFTYAPGYTLHAAMQCTPDLSREQCLKCLYSAILMAHPCCNGKVSARMVSPNCYLRYDHEKFDKNQII